MTSLLVLLTHPAISRTRAHGWRRRGAVSAVAVGVLGLAACSETPATSVATDDAPTTSTELADVGAPCPRVLPTGDDPSGHGFGVQEPATRSPSLSEPQEAWLCEYRPAAGAATDQGGTVLTWQREGPAAPVAAADLADLDAALDDLAPADADRACTEELGPRWLVVWANDGDLTGALVDDYGCRDVRLTDHPHDTAPGAADQDGVPGGVLAGGAALLDVLGAGRGS